MSASSSRNHSGTYVDASLDALRDTHFVCWRYSPERPPRWTPGHPHCKL